MRTEPLIVRCHQPTSSQHAACTRARRQAARQRRPLLVVHTYRHRKRGAEVVLELAPGRQPLSAAARRHLEARFELLELAGWLAPGGGQVISPWLCWWKAVPRAVVDEFVADLLASLTVTCATLDLSKERA